MRSAYPEQQPLLNLNNAAVSPPPLVVEQVTLDAYRLVNHNPDRNMWSHLDLGLPEAKAELAELIDCDPGEIALNRNSTEGLCTAIFGIPLAAGDQVVISPWDYPSVRAAWFQRQEREGIEVVTADYDLMDGDDEIFEAYAAVLTPRTRVLQITHMSHWTGRVVPTKRLCRLAKDNGTLTVVDGAQTFAQMPVSFRDLACDFFITSLHKWMGAPVGNGMLVVRRASSTVRGPCWLPSTRRHWASTSSTTGTSARTTRLSRPASCPPRASTGRSGPKPSMRGCAS